jgi:hypothetical protein
MARYALVIGIATYNKFSNLEKAVTDAEAIAQLLERQGNFQEVKRLPAKWLKDEGRWAVTGDKKLTGKELGNALRTFFLEQAAKNEAVIYFAGHGFPVSSCMGVEEGYLATSDCSEDGRNAILLRHFNALMMESDLSSLVVMLDCCYAGTLLERQLLEPTFTAFNTKRDYYLITACRGFQKAYEGVEHGVFTGAILKGLAAENADEKGQVSGDRLFDFIYRELKGSGQEPIRLCSGRSLTLVQYPPTKTTVVVDETCPYQGLQAFDKEQARFFFGRERVVQLLVEKLGQANFVPIIGASGSGKSSVVRAGLIPRLEKNGWRVLEPILPGDEPLAELKTVLIELFGRTEGREVYSLIKTDGLRPVIERLSGSERFLLVVDQFEEVFTLCPKEKEQERHQFIELLTQVAEIPASRLAIVTTMRADFLEPCLNYPTLTHLIQQNQAVWLVSFLEGSDLEQAIVKPAEVQGYSFENGLLGAILQDVGNEHGCLPLLQFALKELWEKCDRQKHQLTVEQYRALEGVTGALNRHAEKIYTYKDFLKEFPQQERLPQEQEWIKRIFLKLVRTGEAVKDSRQRQSKAKLLAIAGDNPDERQALSCVLDELVQGRLLATGQDKQHKAAWVDLAHEALMERWQWFAQWRQENRQLRRLIDRVEDALREWQKEPKNENLMMGGLLVRVQEKWFELEPYLDTAAREFYQQSDSYEKKREKEIRQLQNQFEELKDKFKEMNQENENLRLQLGLQKHSEFSIELQELQAACSEEESAIRILSFMPNNTEQAISNLKEKVVNYLGTLERFEQRRQISKIAAQWLDDNRILLIQDTINHVMGTNYRLANLDELEDLPEEDRQFGWDIDDYIDWLCYSLKLGEPIPLDEVDITPTLDKSNYAAAFKFISQDKVSNKLFPLDEVDITPTLDKSNYAAAFKFISQDKVSNKLSEQIAKTLEAYLGYLIKRFSPSSAQ